jgi:cobalt-zinc-cadmium resistance protein CzcA
MLAKLIQFSLTQRLLMVLVIIGLTGAGWRAFNQTPIDAFPDVASTQVKIIMKAPGMTPEEVESRIAVPVEVEMLGIPNTKTLRSVTKYGLVDVTIDFQDGIDIFWARQQVAERLGNLSDSLPEGISGGMAPITTPLGEMFMFTVDGDSLSLVERRSLLDWVIRPALRTVPGVADVNSLGGLVRTFEVLPDPMKMAANKITLEQLSNALSINNRNRDYAD